MKRSAFDESRDERVVHEAGVDQRLMCTAHGCPNLWSTSNGHLCRWHADAPKDRWPQVTADMQHDETERARRAAEPPAPAPPTLSEREKRAILARFRNVLAEPKDPRAWVKRLQRLRADGVPLSSMQRHALTQVENRPGADGEPA